jgi:diadenosine tetraphosphate (Ap4A) HIT family hydrolase
MAREPGCPLCEGEGGALVVSTTRFRVIRAAEAGFAAFYRVIWHDHTAEFTQLPIEQRVACMDAVAIVEGALRKHLAPTKVNLAALGNMVPHLHWHVVARFDWDATFPASPWSPSAREVPADKLAQVRALLPAVEEAITTRVNSIAWPA